MSKYQTRYHYEKVWQNTNEKELLDIIAQEVGDADVEGTLRYVKEVLGKGKEIQLGTCKVRYTKN